MKEENNNKEKGVLSRNELIAFAFDVGYSIIVPLVLLGLGGRLLDKKLETSPWFFIGGILFSLVITSISIYKKVKKIAEF